MSCARGWTRSEPAGPVCGRADEERQDGCHTVKRWLPFPEMPLGTSVLKHTRSALKWCAFDRDDLQEVSCSLHNSNATTSSANESGSACLLAPLLLRSLLLRAGCPSNRVAPGGAGTPPSTASRRKPNSKPQTLQINSVFSFGLGSPAGVTNRCAPSCLALVTSTGLATHAKKRATPPGFVKTPYLLLTSTVTAK